MLEELGELFGWLIIFGFVGTILNYCLKYVNKRFGKKINAKLMGKKIMKIMMTVFVRNHRFFGLATALFLLAHFVIQYIQYGINVTGLIAAVILILQVLLGIYANVKKKPRKGLWFITHRIIAVLIIFGVAVHLIIPNLINGNSDNNDTNQQSETIDTSSIQSFTLKDLAKYDGQNGNKAYVAYKGIVYDVTDIQQWKNGSHNGQNAGTDITSVISNAPHGNSVLDGIPTVGKIN